MRGAIHYPHGIAVVYSRTNVGWLVLWHQQVLAVKSKKKGCDGLRGRAHSEKRGAIE